jgi:DNA-binding transcriptional LysR family regulator
MEIRLLKTFVTVARLKGFSAAARALNTVQPAVSRQISDLEAELGVSLFWRSTREVRITAAGELLLQEAEEILAHEERARKAVQLAGRGQVGRLRIGFLGSACQSFLPKLVQHYAAAQPNVQISLLEMTAEEQAQALAARQLDISLSRSLPETTPENITSITIYHDRLMVFAPERHPLSAASIVSLQDLASVPLVLFKRSGALMLFDQIVSACRMAGFSPDILHRPNSMQAVLTSVSAGLGVAIAPGCICKLDMTGCKGLYLRDETAAIPFMLHYDATIAEPPTLTFVKLVEDAISQIRVEMTPENRASL